MLCKQVLAPYYLPPSVHIERSGILSRDCGDEVLAADVENVDAVPQPPEHALIKRDLIIPHAFEF